MNDVPLSERLSYSIKEFCALHGIGRTSFYKFLSEGRGPDFFKVGNRIRIPVEAARSWRPDQGGEAL